MYSTDLLTTHCKLPFLLQHSTAAAQCCWHIFFGQRVKTLSSFLITAVLSYCDFTVILLTLPCDLSYHTLIYLCFPSVCVHTRVDPQSTCEQIFAITSGSHMKPMVAK